MEALPRRSADRRLASVATSPVIRTDSLTARPGRHGDGARGGDGATRRAGGGAAHECLTGAAPSRANAMIRRPVPFARPAGMIEDDLHLIDNCRLTYIRRTTYVSITLRAHWRRTDSGNDLDARVVPSHPAARSWSVR